MPAGSTHFIQIDARTLGAQRRTLHTRCSLHTGCGVHLEQAAAGNPFRPELCAYVPGDDLTVVASHLKRHALEGEVTEGVREDGAGAVADSRNCPRKNRRSVAGATTPR